MKLSSIIFFLTLYGFCTLSNYEEINPKGLTKLSRQRRFLGFLGGAVRTLGKFFASQFTAGRIVTGVIPAVVKVRA